VARRRRRALPFEPVGDGTFRIGLEPEERALIEDLPRQLKALLESGDETSTKRLFPPAYHQATDSEREEEFQRYMRDELLSSKLGAMELLGEKAQAETLTETDMIAWMGAINDVRLVLGTQLDVYEGQDLEDFADNDPRLPAFSVYTWLSGILEVIVHRLAGEDI
jgi:hypothetical protein